MRASAGRRQESGLGGWRELLAVLLALGLLFGAARAGAQTPGTPPAGGAGTGGPFGSVVAPAAGASQASAGDANANAAPRNPGLFVQESVKVQETYTSNAGFTYETAGRSDLISELIPSLVVREVGRRFDLNADVSVDAVDYLKRSEPNALLPRGSVDGTLDAIENHLSIEGGVLATQVPSNYLEFIPQETSVYNTYTAYTYHASPDFHGAFASGAKFDLRSDNAWSHATSGQAQFSNTYFGHDGAEFDTAPAVFGATLRYDRNATDFGTTSAPDDIVQILRLIVRAKVNLELTVGLRGGVEQDNFLLDDARRPIYGAELDWRPTSHTELNGFVEHRNFGTAFNYALTNHTPWVSVTLNGLRDISTSPQELFALPATTSVATALDNMLLSQYPDAVTRAQAVQNLIASENLPTSLAGPAAFYSPTAFLTETESLSAVWTGRRSALTLSVFTRTTEILPVEAQNILTATSVESDNVQRGAGLTFNHHVTPFANVVASLNESHIVGINAANGNFARQSSAKLELDYSISVRSNVDAGVREQHFESNTTGAVREAAIFAGLTHRF